MSDTTEDELRDALMAQASTYNLDKQTLARMREDVVETFYRGMIPKAARIDIPFLNKFLMRECGSIFAGMGQQFMSISYRNDIDERHMLLDGLGLVRSAQRRILYLRGGNSVWAKMMENKE